MACSCATTCSIRVSLACREGSTPVIAVSSTPFCGCCSFEEDGLALEEDASTRFCSRFSTSFSRLSARRSTRSKALANGNGNDGGGGRLPDGAPLLRVLPSSIPLRRLSSSLLSLPSSPFLLPLLLVAPCPTHRSSTEAHDPSEDRCRAFPCKRRSSSTAFRAMARRWASRLCGEENHDPHAENKVGGEETESPCPVDIPG